MFAPILDWYRPASMSAQSGFEEVVVEETAVEVVVEEEAQEPPATKPRLNSAFDDLYDTAFGDAEATPSEAAAIHWEAVVAKQLEELEEDSEEAEAAEAAQQLEEEAEAAREFHQLQEEAEAAQPPGGSGGNGA